MTRLIYVIQQHERSEGRSIIAAKTDRTAADRLAAELNAEINNDCDVVDVTEVELDAEAPIRLRASAVYFCGVVTHDHAARVLGVSVDALEAANPGFPPSGRSATISDGWPVIVPPGRENPMTGLEAAEDLIRQAKDERRRYQDLNTLRAAFLRFERGEP